MGYHHLALAARDMKAVHAFYEGVMEFELVKVEIGPAPEGGWAKHFFYRMEDDSKFIAFWELHDVPGTEGFETNLSKAAGVPEFWRSTIIGATRSIPKTRTAISSSSA